jgi:hypothetical protein
LLKDDAAHGRALLNHNRDIGMLRGDRMAVLGLRQTVEFYEGDPKRGEMSLLRAPGDAERELEKDTMAIYQVADDLYVNQRYRLDEK